MKCSLVLMMVLGLLASAAFATEDFPLEIQTKHCSGDACPKKPMVKRIEIEKSETARFAPKSESADTGAVNKNKKEPWFNF
jgi:hypothetical protein